MPHTSQRAQAKKRKVAPPPAFVRTTHDRAWHVRRDGRQRSVGPSRRARMRTKGQDHGARPPAGWASAVLSPIVQMSPPGPEEGAVVVGSPCPARVDWTWAAYMDVCGCSSPIRDDIRGVGGGDICRVARCVFTVSSNSVHPMRTVRMSKRSTSAHATCNAEEVGHISPSCLKRALLWVLRKPCRPNCVCTSPCSFILAEGVGPRWMEPSSPATSCVEPP